MLKLTTAAAALAMLGGQALAQQDMAPANVTCSEFAAMSPDEQTIALNEAMMTLEQPAAQGGGQPAAAAPAQEPAAGGTPAGQQAGGVAATTQTPEGQQPGDGVLEEVVAACEADQSMTLGAALVEANEN